MPRGDVLNRAVAARIRGSSHTLTVHYPAARPAATGAVPGAAPVSPLTGAVPATVVIPPDPTPTKAAVTMPCLWTSLQSVRGDLYKDQTDWFAAGWVEGASAVARVLIEDAAEDVTKPYGDTVFTDCAYVEFAGERYTVLAVKSLHASFCAPVSYYVAVTGAGKQA